MTTTDTYGNTPPPPRPGTGRRLLRRSRTDRVAAGVSGGLGEYFGLDPVLFRVLFAVSAFFGGAGILAYLLAWAAIPEIGTERAPIDGWVGALRRRRIPFWLVAVAAGVLLWAVAFSWWAPGPFFPVVAVVVLLVIFFGRREMQASPPAAKEPTISLTKTDEPAPTGQPSWVRDARSWYEESRAAARERRRRARPLRYVMLGALVVGLITLAALDALTGIDLQYYFWTTLGIVGIGTLAGLATRRTAWSLTPLLLPAIAGTVAFAGSHASLSDGIGQREWTPTTAPAAEYRLAFGQGILDLRSLPTPDAAQTIHVTLGAGQVKIIAPSAMNLTVLANVHIGSLEVDGNSEHQHGGVGLSRTVHPKPGATGAPITVDVHLADGQVAVERH
jgi:phage shock protein PspC (stress-responsive transcriptional regulator)/FtsH-binding integral membrane protein